MVRTHDDIWKRIEDLDAEVAKVKSEMDERAVKLAVLSAERKALRRLVPLEPTPAATLTERVVEIVKAAGTPVNVQDVVEALANQGVQAESRSVATLLGRRAGPGGPLRSVKRGYYEADGPATTESD